MSVLERKFDAVAAQIREKIRSGDYRERIPGERDLAELFGVHVLTANKAVTSLVDEGLLYRLRGRGTFITRLRRPRTHTLAAVVGDVLAPLHAQIVRGMEAAARRAGQDLLFYNRGDDAQAEEVFVDQIITREKADGILLWPTRYDAQSPGIRRAAAAKLPLVVFPHLDLAAGESVSAVLSDDRDGARVVTQHLLELGHRRLGLVLPPRWASGSVPGANRLDGCSQELAAHDLPPPVRIVLDPHELVASVRREQLTALFCTTDDTAISAIKLLEQAGLSVPADISVAGFDGVSRSADFDLTTFEQPMEAIGGLAVELLLQDVNGECVGPVQLTIPGSLIVRGSTRSL